ncbi:engulfment and cell motility protein 2 [Capsaspora owczarzaki ATCC 30864]|uniref:Engulfment and cell motility protein 2 n=1 Tax=Capsaspora owczarzaki (strain ATCC 30864) TaxID=595528 RepID=A0A0D2WL47_CAPO3|nr:engulfment and cell motility protein 2 [Capsaspora owczarzaki ATCC 30864]KJE91200.1 engulfment and cell motility protein 2 [Capsaspora owczarzaki ATCC 30864]|eukprot:XP_004349115.1 engulfment and cell motility protein 2 [Capsaspora owczarzaki ATCC 30864]
MEAVAQRRPVSNTLKVGIKMEGANPLMYELDTTLPLAVLVREVCERFQVAHAVQSDFCLYCEDTDQFLTSDATIRELRDGNVLELRQTPEIAASKLISSLRGSEEDVKKAFVGLRNQIKNTTFANIFIAKGGLPLIVKHVQESTAPSTLGFALQMLQELVDRGTTGWEGLSDSFVQKICGYTEHQNLNVKKRALAIADRFVSSPAYGYGRVAPHLRCESMITMMDGSSDLDIQSNTISLFNTLLLNAGSHQPEFLQKILSLNIRKALLNVARKSGGVNDELAHQLYVFQSVWFNSLAQRIQAVFNRSSSAHNDMLNELQARGADAEPSSPLPSGARKPNDSNARLGFDDETTRALSSPYGLLALECMAYFSRKHTEIYQRIIIEQASRGQAQCPFAKTTLHIVKLIAEIMQIGTPPSEHSLEFYIVVFSTDHPMEELVGACVQLFVRTWKEMDASSADFDKVLKVVRKQITTVLANKQESQPQSVETFKTATFGVSYKTILAQQETEMQEKESVHHQAEPVRQLRERIQTDIVQLVKKHRLSLLVEGAFFPKYTQKGRMKGVAWFCRLSNNHKVIHYGDAPEGRVPSLESLPGRVNMSDVKALVMGRDSPLMTKMKKTDEETASLAFSLLLESSEEGLDFVAPNLTVANNWIDGLKILLKQNPSSTGFASDVESLLSMEMKLRLLHVENVQIPATAPPVPPPPANLNFAF